MPGKGFKSLFELLEMLSDLEKRARLRAEEITRERGRKAEAEEDANKKGG
jgi:hypothetical protein